MKPKNLKEFKALKKRYESITLEEIKGFTLIGCKSPNELVGFRSRDTCTLCKYGCHVCVYRENVRQNLACLNGENRETYINISNAIESIKLLNAFRARAKHMETILKENHGKTQNSRTGN